MPDSLAAATDVALAYQAATKTIAGRLSTILATLWRQAHPWTVQADWEQRLPEAVGAFTAAQDAAAGMADGYVSAALAAQGSTTAGGLVVDPAAFAGRAASGLSLENLLSIPAYRAQQAVLGGMHPNLAMQAGEGSLRMYAATETADAARAASQVAATTRGVKKYMRVTGPLCCGRCAILSGRLYRVAEFDRHPNCFPAGVVVSGPHIDSAARRWFEGELVSLTTASGQNLSLTGNHPVLTRGGWVPANLLQEGDEVVRSTRAKGASALIVPDHDQVPAMIEDVWRSLGVFGLTRMPTSAQDFHGDGGHGEVDIADADGALRYEHKPRILHEARKVRLARGLMGADCLVGDGFPDLAEFSVRREELPSLVASRLPLLIGHRVIAGPHSASDAPASHSLERETLSYAGPTYAMVSTESQFTHPEHVGAGYLDIREGPLPSGWDAPSGPFSVENRGRHASKGIDLWHRLSGQVEFDRLVEVRHGSFAGHVYSLSSSEGWHSANGLIVSNCHCGMLPVDDPASAEVPDPMTLYRGGRITGLSKAEREALDMGADLSQVVNARDGMYTAGGRRYTTAGTTIRGVAGARLTAAAMDRSNGRPAGLYTNFTVSRTQVAQAAGKYTGLMRRGTPFQRVGPAGVTTAAYSRAGTPRRSVSQILTDHPDHGAATTALINEGYILRTSDAAQSTTSLERIFRTG